MSTYPLGLGSKFGRSLSWSCDSIGRSSVLQRSDKRSSLYLPRMPLQSRAVIGNEKQEQWFAQLSFIFGKNLTTRTDKAEGRRAPRQNSFKKVPCKSDKETQPRTVRCRHRRRGHSPPSNANNCDFSVTSFDMLRKMPFWLNRRSIFFQPFSPPRQQLRWKNLWPQKPALPSAYSLFFGKVHENSIIPDRLI